MTYFERLLEQQLASSSAMVETDVDLVRNGDFALNRLSDHRLWETMSDTGDGSWYAVSGQFEVQRATGLSGTPAKKVITAVLELDSHTGARAHGATNSNAVVSQVIEEITQPGTFRLSLDYSARNKTGVANEDTSSAEVWLGDKLVATLTNTDATWQQRIIEVDLQAGDLPADGPVMLRLVATGIADGYGALIDNVSLREIGKTGLLSEDLITNGAFENSAHFGRWKTFSELDGWTVSEDSVFELQHVRKPTTPRDPSDVYIELDGHGSASNSEVAQDIEVTEAGLYLLSFEYSPRWTGATTEESSGMEVKIGDTVIAEISSGEVGWQPYTFNVHLDEGPVTLSFRGTGTQDTRGALVGNVALVRVQEELPLAISAQAAVEAQPGLLGEVFFAETDLRNLEQAVAEKDETPDATFVATAIDYGNMTSWSYATIDVVLEHDAGSLNEDADLQRNVDHTYINLSGEIFLEAGTHTFLNRTDDGFRLTIDDTLVAEYQGLRTARTTEGTITVANDGWYAINIDYFDWRGASQLRIEHRLNDGPLETLSDDRLRHTSADDDNTAPDAVADLAQTTEDTPIVIDVLANDVDADGDALALMALGTARHGSVSDNGDGTVTFIPDADFNGEATFTYTISDGSDSATGTATVTVTPVNDAPYAVTDTKATTRDGWVQIDVLSNDFDVDPGDVLTLVSAVSDRGHVEIVDGEIVFTPGSDFDDMVLGSSVEQIVTYTVRDQAGAIGTGSLIVTVTAPFEEAVEETLLFREIGANGSSRFLDGEDAIQSVESVVLAGSDNRDTLEVEMLSRAGNGREGARGDRGTNDDYLGTDGSAGTSGGLAGDAWSDLASVSIDGRESADMIEVTVNALGGNGGDGADGGGGGAADRLGTHRVVVPGISETTTTYGNGVGTTGGNGGDGGHGNDAGASTASVSGGLIDGGDSADTIIVRVEAVGGDGGAGGRGGIAGRGGNDAPLGGTGANTSRAGNSGDGGNGGSAMAQVSGLSILGDLGDDDITLDVSAVGGAGGIGGRGRAATEASWQDTTFTNFGDVALNTYDGEFRYVLGTAGDGGNGGTAGDAHVRIEANTLDGGVGDDMLRINAQTIIAGEAQGGDGGSGGTTSFVPAEASGRYDLYFTAGTNGQAGADGATGQSQVDILSNTLDGGSGDDTLQIALDVPDQGALGIAFSGNVVNGGSGLDRFDLSLVHLDMTVDLGAGEFGLKGSSDINSVTGVEVVLTGDGDDILIGSANAETLEAGAGDDLLTGNGALDTFVFRTGLGHDIITDFSDDRIDLSDVTGVSGFDQLEIQDGPDGAVIVLASGTVTLLGVGADQLNQDHFIF